MERTRPHVRADGGRLSVLGHVSVWDAVGGEVRLGQVKIDILASLAARLGGSMHRDDLCRALWGHATTTERNRLKTAVSQIRSVLPPGLEIVRTGDEYALMAQPGSVDLATFLEMADADDAADADHWRTALGLWSGAVPFAGTRHADVDARGWQAVAARERVVLRLAKCLVAAPGFDEVVPELAALVDDDPTRSDVVALLAEGLARQGRHVHAARLLARHATSLAEIGAVPSPDLTRLEGAILSHELSPRRPLAEGSSSIGRRDVLPRPDLEVQITEVLRSGPVLLLGEPGTGRTTVVGRLAAQDDTSVVVHVGSTPRRPLDAVASLVEALIEADPGPMAALLEVEAHRSAWNRVADPHADGAKAMSRDELIDGLSELAIAAVSGASRLVAIDDVQHLDALSAQVLRRVVDAKPAGLLITARSDRHGIGVGATTIEVPPFELAETTAWLRDILQVELAETAIAELHRRCEGNPLFLALLADVLLDDEVPDQLPGSVHLAVETRLGALSAQAVEALRAAALIGREFPLDVVAALVDDGDRSVAEAQREGLVVVDADRAWFRHEIVAEVLVTGLPLGRRVEIHDRICDLLTDRGESAEGVAPHALGAATIDPVRAARLCLTAATEHAVRLSWDAAATWCSEGLAALGSERPHSELVCDLLQVRGTARRRSNRAGSDTDLLDAASVARHLADAPRLVDAATELCLQGPTSQAGGVDPRAHELLEEALTLDVDMTRRAHLCSAAATLLTMSSDWARGRALFREALAMHRTTGADRRQVLMHAHIGLSHPDDLALRRRVIDELAVHPDIDARWETAFLRFNLAMVEGDVEKAAGSLTQMRELSAEHQLRAGSRGMLQSEAAFSHLRGDLDLAERQADEFVAVALATTSESWAMSIYSGLIFPIRDAQGRLGELASAIDSLQRQSPDYLTWTATAGAIAAVTGDRLRARSELRSLVRAGMRFEQDLTWLAVVSLAARAAHVAEDRDVAEHCVALLEPYQSLMAWNGVAVHGPVSAACALAADTLGRTDDARRWRDQAIMQTEMMSAPHLLWPDVRSIP